MTQAQNRLPLTDIVRRIIRHEAATQTAKSKVDVHWEREWPLLDKLMTAAKSGDLKVYNHGEFQSIVLDKLPQPSLLMNCEAYLEDVDAWLDLREPRTPFRFAQVVKTSVTPTSLPTSVEPREAAPIVAWRTAMVKQWTPMLAHHGGRYPGPADAVAWFKANDRDGAFVQTSDGDADAFHWIGADGKRHTTRIKTFQNAVSDLNLPRSLPI